MANKVKGPSFHVGLTNLSKGAFSGTSKQTWSAGSSNLGIKFGRPSQASALLPAKSTGTDWAAVAKNAASNGLFAAGSGLSHGLLGSFSVGGLISGIASLFGSGKKTLPPLQLFQLPDSMQQTVHLQSGSSGSGSGSAVHVHVQAIDAQSFAHRSGDIAQAVRTAMLNSSSLNDVIAEL